MADNVEWHIRHAARITKRMSNCYYLEKTKVCVSLNQFILKLHLFTLIQFDKNKSADLKFHTTYQISIELNLIFKAFLSMNLEIFLMKYGTTSQENNNLLIHITLQRCCWVFKSGWASRNVVGIICPPGANRVN